MLSLTLGMVLLLPQVQAAAPATAVDEVRSLTVARDNDARFEAVAALLRAHDVPFMVEAFTLPKPLGQDPRTTGRNIVVTLGGGADHVLIGAHYDAVRLPDGSLGPGAVDNAGSSVALVRLAAALRRAPLGLAVRIVWFDMEESGLTGSRHYAEAHAMDRPLAMINFDINAYGDTVLFAQPEGSRSPAIERAMAVACAAEGIDCLRSASMPPGDDRTFGKAGVPSLSVATLPAIEAHQAWLLFNAGGKAGLAPGMTLPIMQTIHTPADVIDKVEDATVAQLARLAAALLRQLAAAPLR